MIVEIHLVDHGIAGADAINLLAETDLARVGCGGGFARRSAFGGERTESVELRLRDDVDLAQPQRVDARARVETAEGVVGAGIFLEGRGRRERSEVRRVGKECVSTCSSRGTP